MQRLLRRKEVFLGKQPFRKLIVMTVKNIILLEEVEDMINETEFLIKICNAFWATNH